MKTYSELEKAVNWLLTSKSPMVDGNAQIQQHIMSNITSIKRIAAMFNISNTEALLMTHQGLSNGFHPVKKDIKVASIKKVKKIKKVKVRDWSAEQRAKFQATHQLKKEAKVQGPVDSVRTVDTGQLEDYKIQGEIINSEYDEQKNS